MSVWTENQFPTLDVDVGNWYRWIGNGRPWIGKGRTLSGKSDHWKAKRRKPFCWTPTKQFRFGGKEFIPLYPCIAFETTNFGHIIQRTWEGLKAGKE